MSRLVPFLLLALFVATPRLLSATPPDDGPPINITSPDTASTFAFGTVKSHTLLWDKKNKLLIARIVFIDTGETTGQSTDDEHDFHLPGVSFDETSGLFSAVSAKGEVIPVAKIKKGLFTKDIVILANANVKVSHPHGNVTVSLVAISPTDPILRAPPPSANPDGTQKVDPRSLLQ